MNRNNSASTILVNKNHMATFCRSVDKTLFEQHFFHITRLDLRNFWHQASKSKPHWTVNRNLRCRHNILFHSICWHRLSVRNQTFHKCFNGPPNIFDCLFNCLSIISHTQGGCIGLVPKQYLQVFWVTALCAASHLKICHS